jgi:hypothetical protein
LETISGSVVYYFLLHLVHINLVFQAMDELKKNIAKGEAFV